MTVFSKKLSVSDIKRISVAVVNDRYVTWDNRRLWVFRQLEKLGKCDVISVNLKMTIDENRLTTKCEGREVTVRGDPGGFCYKYLKLINKQSSRDVFSESRQPTKRSSNKTHYVREGSANKISNESIYSSKIRPESLYPRKTNTPDTTPYMADSFLDILSDIARIGMGLAAVYVLWKLS